jgi:folate-dependent phosphoribosylglycinamide formyltransferase PurN
VPGHRIVLLTGGGGTGRIAFHALSRAFPDIAIIVEERVPRTALIKRRLRTLGPGTVVGQLIFMTTIMPLVARLSRSRIAEIKRQHGLDESPLPSSVHRVTSVNAPETRELLRRLDPAVVVVLGTRIIGRSTLQSISVPVINFHAGITPLYRGVHGGYWALAEGRPELAGSTIHLVDPGIDTGQVIAQETFVATSRDSFATYPYLHIAVGIPMLVSAVRDALTGSLVTTRNPLNLPSQLRTHPTCWHYLWTLAAKHVK